MQTAFVAYYIKKVECNKENMVNILLKIMLVQAERLKNTVVYGFVIYAV